MLKEMVLLAWYGEAGGGFDTLFSQWDSLGVFTYLLPFLLIFALVFGILSKLNLFGDNSKKINAIVALAVGLIALRTNAVSVFFADIFPRLGIALAAVLIFVIVLGLFGDGKNRGLMNTLMWAAFGVAIVILLQSTEMFGGGITSIFALIPGWIVPLIVLIVLIAIVTSDKKNKNDNESFLARALRSN
ncbi:MAG: hypothetical protein ABH811_00285 [archaeon]